MIHASKRSSRKREWADSKRWSRSAKPEESDSSGGAHQRGKTSNRARAARGWRETTSDPTSDPPAICVVGIPEFRGQVTLLTANDKQVDEGDDHRECE